MKTLFTSDSATLALYRRAFPETNFRTITLREFHGPMSLNSYWDSGYRDYFRIFRLSDGMPLGEIAQNGTPFDGKNFELSALPEGHAVAVHSYQGTRQSGSLYLNPANLTPLIPASTADFTWLQKAVLSLTAGLKSAYRRDEARRLQITGAEWDATVSELVARGLLKANGAITNEGRNTLSQLFPGSICSPNGSTLAQMEGGRGYHW